jgi:hypothetical protein
LKERPARNGSRRVVLPAGTRSEFDNVSILQCFVTLSDQIHEENRTRLEQLIVKLNAKLPIGSFGLLDNPRLVFFKHNAILPNNNPTAVRALVPLRFWFSPVGTKYL